MLQLLQQLSNVLGSTLPLSLLLLLLSLLLLLVVVVVVAAAVADSVQTFSSFLVKVAVLLSAYVDSGLVDS
jgi:hypothetical protein